MNRIYIFLTIIIMTISLSSCNKSDNISNQPLNIIEDKNRNYYEIFVRSFCDSNNDKIGDLKGVTSKLDYIKDLGFNGIWLTPINKSSSYHKYDVMDYYEVDFNFGTMDDLEELIRECHKRNITLILDLVLNHSSINNELFTKAKNAHSKSVKGTKLSEEEEKYKDFYNFYDSKENIPRNITAYKANGEEFYYEANFTSEMPEFNWDNTYVKEYFKNVIKFYLEKGIDGFRLDAVKYYYFLNHNKNVELLNELYEYAKSINENVYFVGECFDSKEVIDIYYQSGCDSFFNFPGSIAYSSSYIYNSINRDGIYLNNYYNGMVESKNQASGNIPAQFLDNHDTPRFTSASNPSKTKFQYALLQMLNGSTFTYYGDEVGMVGTNAGASNPDENVRLPMHWGEEGNKGNCSPENAITKSDYPYGTVKDQISDKDSIYNFYKQCLLIRNQNPEIARGEITLISSIKEEKEKSLFITKEYNDKRIGIIMNFSETYEAVVSFKEYGFTNVCGILTMDSSNKVKNMKNGIKLPPYSIVVVR